MKPSDRILICRNSINRGWSVISDPRWDHFTKAASAILLNDFNEYVEWTNTGITSRMIRRRDHATYFIPQDSIGLSLASQV